MVGRQRPSGAYVEQIGLKRLHEDCWLYSIFCPIDAGLLNTEQAAQSLFYTEWGLEREQMPYGGERVWPSNWVPSIWSLREMWPGDNYQLALAYFQTGMADDGWNVLRGTFPHLMFFGPVPGDLGHTAGGTDFNDCASMFARTVVEGLFGYRPNYPHGIVTIAPQFPSDWDHAAIKTPDMAIKFTSQAGRGPIRDRVGQSRRAGCEIAAKGRAGHKSHRERPSGEVGPATGLWQRHDPARRRFVPVGDNRSGLRTAVAAVRGRTGCRERRQAGVVAGKGCGNRRVSRSPGRAGQCGRQRRSHCGRVDAQRGRAFSAGNGQGRPDAAMAAVKDKADRSGSGRGEGCKADATRLPRMPDGNAWTFPSNSMAIYAGYSSSNISLPVRLTCSLRLATDGYSTWQMSLDPKNRPPSIDLTGVPKILDDAGRIVTPQGVPFAWPGKDHNIAFTSQWDNWPRSVSVPVGARAMPCGCWCADRPIQCRAESPMPYCGFGMRTARKKNSNLCRRLNFWSLCRFEKCDYDYKRDGFALPKEPPKQVQLGENCRAMVYGWKLRPGEELETVTLETLSQEVVIGLMGVSVMNPN